MVGYGHAHRVFTNGVSGRDLPVRGRGCSRRAIVTDVANHVEQLELVDRATARHEWDVSEARLTTIRPFRPLGFA